MITILERFGAALRDRLAGRRRLAWLLLTAVVYLLYLKTLSFRLTAFDDTGMLQQMHSLLQSSGSFPSAAVKAFREAIGEFYRPLLTLSLLVDVRLERAIPFIGHLTNVLLHLGGVLMLYELLRRMRYADGTALAFSLIFAVHPALVQAVAWIPGRNDALLGISIFASFYFLVGYLESARPREYWLHLLAFAAALLTKETALVFPLCGLGYLMVSRQTPRLRQLLAGWVPLVACFLFLRNAALSGVPDINIADKLHQLWQGLPALILYAGKVLLPFELSALSLLADSSLWYGAAAMVVLAGAGGAAARTRSMGRFLFGLAWFILFLLPGFAGAKDFHLEHRLYVPMIGVIFMLDGAVALFSGTRCLRRAMVVAAGTVLILFCILNYRHSDDFSGRVLLWKHAVATAPHSPTAHARLAEAYMAYGLLDAAEIEIRRTLALQPRFIDAQFDLALLYWNRKDTRNARETFDGLLKVRENAVYCTNFAEFLESTGDDVAAEAQWVKSFRYDPRNFYGYKKLIENCKRQKKYALAQRYEDELRSRYKAER